MNEREKIREQRGDPVDKALREDDVDGFFSHLSPDSHPRGRLRAWQLTVMLALGLGGVIFAGHKIRERARREIARIIEDPLSVERAKAFTVAEKALKAENGQKLVENFWVNLLERLDDSSKPRKEKEAFIGGVNPFHPAIKILLTPESQEVTSSPDIRPEYWAIASGLGTQEGRALAEGLLQKIIKLRQTE